MSVSRETPENWAPVPPTPAQAAEAFADRLPVAEAYARLLATDGVERGLIGPREIPRLWDRHLLNCAVVRDVIPTGSRVADIGSGAGLPGIPLALSRPDLQVVLVEPMLRRTTFLEQVVADLSLDNVLVVRGRAQELPDESMDVALARAVAPLVRLLPMAWSCVRPGGAIVAMKGERAQAEIDAAGKVLRRLGAAGTVDVVTLGSGASAARVVTVRRP